MSRFTKSALIASAAVVFSFGQAAWAQDADIDFGDDASVWANDGECDDSRFVGTGMTNTSLLDEDRSHDASDCRAAFEAGDLTLRAETGPSTSAAADKMAREAANTSGSSSVVTLPTEIIDYGDNTSVWANDGECDDPRFTGPNVATSPSRSNASHDENDCRASVNSGTATFTGELDLLFSGTYDGVDFGDNEGGFPADDECDDPRFSGSNVAIGANRANTGHDAHDCKISYEAGTATFDGELQAAFVGEYDGVDFGDNEGSYPLDDECDDPRFSGDNVATGANRSNALHDADDCYTSYLAGTATFVNDLEPLFEGEYDGVDFGDNSGPYVEDKECDDPRFEGQAMAAGTQRRNLGRDAFDCYTAYVDGTVTYTGELEPLFSGTHDGIDFGDNEGPYIDDMECDDPRFRGVGMAHPAWSSDSETHDASDCKWMYERGFVTYAFADNLLEGRYRGVDYGDNSGTYVNDGECDDSRFEGPGVGDVNGANDRQDAHDCRVNFEAGSIVLKDQ